MTIGRKGDIACTILLLAPLLLYTSTGADPLYTSAWYLLGVPLAMLLPGVLLQAPPLFLSGTTAAAIASLLTYVMIISSLPHPDGLLGLGHLFSLPGMLLGAAASAWLLRYRVRAKSPLLVAGLAFLGAAGGFLVAQIIVCNTAMYCGGLSIGM